MEDILTANINKVIVNFSNLISKLPNASVSSSTNFISNMLLQNY